MTNRERIRNCGRCLLIDRTPFIASLGPWDEVYELWEKEGIYDRDAYQNDFPFDKQVVMAANYVNHLYCPAFEKKEISRCGDIIRLRDEWGVTLETVAGRSGIPRIVDSPVKNEQDWEKLKHSRLDPLNPARFPENWAQLAAQLNADDAPVQVGCWPCGLYGTLRDLMGVEGSLFAFYDYPELVHDIMDTLTNVWLGIFEKVCKDIKVDILHIWEDMSGKTGPLISPECIEEFMLPNYKKLSDFAAAHDIAIVQVDTDGNCDMLIPLFAKGGVNQMMPFEVAAGSDVTELRKKYPYMSLVGGIDKMEIAKGKDATDKELTRIEPLLFGTGYVPILDHRIPPEMSYKAYSYFVNRLHDMIFQ